MENGKYSLRNKCQGKMRYRRDDCVGRRQKNKQETTNIFLSVQAEQDEDWHCTHGQATWDTKVRYFML